MARSSLNSINHTLDQLVSSLKIDHSLPSPSPGGALTHPELHSTSPESSAPQANNANKQEAARSLPDPYADGVATFQQLKASSVQQCNRANRELLNKLNEVTADNSRLQKELKQVNGEQGQSLRTRSQQDTRAWSQTMATEMSGVSNACDEMAQVAQMLMKRVDSMKIPRIASTHGALPGRAHLPQPPHPPRAGQRADGIGECARDLNQLVKEVSRNSLSNEELLDLLELHRSLTDLLEEKPQPQEKLYPCWICDQLDTEANMTVRCGCLNRMAHHSCLNEWIEMLDGNPLASRCAACDHQFRVEAAPEDKCQPC